MTTLEQSVHRALALHQSGNLDEAGPLYVSVLKKLPHHPDLLHMYGVLRHQQGHSAPAIDYISRAIKANPRNAAFHHNLGEIFRLTKQYDRAIDAYLIAIHLDSAYLAAHQHLASAYFEAGRNERALAAFRQALTLDPNHIESLQFMALAADRLSDNAAALEAFDRLATLRPADAETARNRAVLLCRLNRFTDAVAAYERAIALNPADAGSLFAIVDCLERVAGADASSTDLDAMEQAYRRILTLEPDHVETIVRLGVHLAARNRLDESLIHLRRAVELSPRDPIILQHLAGALQGVPLIDGAIGAYESALAIDATIPGIHADLSAALAKRGRLDEALAAADRAIALNSAHGPAWNNRAAILQDLGRAADAIDAFRTAADLAPENAAIASNYLYAQHYVPHDAAALFAQHVAWAGRFAAGATTTLPDGRVSDGRFSDMRVSDMRVRSRPLRVGLLSPDFKNHSVAFFVEPLLAHLDPARIHLTCYSNVPLEDETTRRLQTLAHAWRPITGLPDAAALQQIKEDRIDILIDLAGHTAHHRLTLLAARPAPIQMTWLGYPNTTGLRAIDYRITDAHADPICGAGACTSPLHTERLLPLPTAWCYQPPASAPAVAALPALARGHVTFACFNNLLKVTPEMVGLWSRMMLALPKSRLLLKASALGTLSARARMLEHFSAQGISPLRVDLRPVERDHTAHLAMYNAADIALDTFPYHGTATTCEALWMGLPVISLAGKTHLSRVGVSLLTSVGLTDCIASTPDAYAAVAARLAGDLPGLAERRAGLRGRMSASPLCNAPAFAAAFTEMLERL